MNQLIDSIISLKGRISNLFHSEIKDSYKRTEYHFHAPVTIIQGTTKQIKKIDNKTLSSAKKILDKPE